MKKQRVKNLALLNKPQGNGLASNSQSHSAEKARAYAFLLLKFRLRSEAELLARLKLKGFSEAVARDTVDFLRDKEFIDDRVFAKGWVASRLKKPFGVRRIKQELLVKGLDKQVIEDSLAEAKKDYSESQTVSQLAQKRFSRLKGIEPLKPQGNGLASNSQSHKAKSRVYAYLLRRGFSPDIVSETIKQL